MIRLPDIIRATARTIAIALLLLPMVSHGGPVSESGATEALVMAAEMESENRKQALEEAARRIDEAREMAADGKSAGALDLLAAVRTGLVPSPLSEPTRAQARDVFTEVALTMAEIEARRGAYDEARALIGRVLDPSMNPESKAAARLLAAVNDNDRFPPALSPGHTANVNRVVDKLRVAESHFQLGNLDASEKTYFDVLLIDRYNSAARRGLERVERMRREYYEAAQVHTRARMLRQVSEAWETANPEAVARAEELVFGRLDETNSEVVARNQADDLKRKAEQLVLGRVVIQDMPLREALEYITNQSRAVDPERRGIDVVVRAAAVEGAAETRIQEREISLSLERVPLAYVLEKLARDVGMVVRYESFAAVLAPMAAADDYLFARTYRVPPDFIVTVPVGGFGEQGGDPFRSIDEGGGFALRRLTPREFLQSAGITFPPGSNVAYNSGNSTLAFRNNAANHELLEALIERSALSGARQVSLSVRMIEVGQRDLEELGFDWLLGAFEVGGGVLASGGTPAASVLSPSDGGIIDPLTGLPIGANMVTAGNRSGNAAVKPRFLQDMLEQNTILRVPDDRLRAPAPLVVAGVLSEPDFMMIMRGLSQKKGTDYVHTPSVVTKSGQPAHIEAVREFVYPSEYDPPELPNEVNFDALTGFPVTPAHPTSFEMKLLGTVLDIEPIISPDGRLVQVALDITFRDFIGFVNYGVPIFSSLSTPFGINPVLLTDNRILQPVFETRRLTNNSSIYDGQLLVVGGLLSQTIEDIEDKTPLLGDVPMLGRFFKSSVRKSTRRVLMIFLQADVLDPSGRPLRELGYGEDPGTDF